MHDIKYFFSIKLIRQSRNKFFSKGGKLLKTLPKNTIFQNSEGQLPLLVYDGSAPAYLYVHTHVYQFIINIRHVYQFYY
jgi:hypothetical protein